jgi:hypothetical protein
VRLPECSYIEKPKKSPPSLLFLIFVFFSLHQWKQYKNQILEVSQFPDFGDRKRVRDMGLRSNLMGLVPFAAMVVVECLDVGLTTLSKAAMSKGMSHYVFVVYSNALATLILIPSSFIIHRSSPCPSTNPNAFFHSVFVFLL